MIKSYDKDNEAIKLIKKAIDVFAQGEATHDSLSRIAHTLGLQGFKRWHRLQSKEDREMRIYIQHYTIDMFSVNLEPSWDYEMENPTNIKEHLEGYLDWEIYVYENISSISNELVIKNFNNESKKISECLCDVAKEIEKTRRWLQDFEYTEYDATYIKLTDKALHDKIKKIEEKE